MSIINPTNFTAVKNNSLQINAQSQQHYLSMQYEEIETKYDADYRALWCILKPSISPTFSLTLLKNIRAIQDNIAKYCFEFPHKRPLYLIWTSDNQNVFNLGLDIKYIYDLILKGDRIALQKYLELCIDIFYINMMKLDIDPLITISLIRGKTFGGGFEAALTSDIIIAEKNVTCSFPGVKYNLLPSVGTLKMLLARFPKGVIEPLLFDGEVLHADELLNKGFIESVVDVGCGKEAVIDKIKLMHDKHNVYSAIYKTKSKNDMISQNDLEDFKDLWVKSALSLKPEHLFKLDRAIQAQDLISQRALVAK